MNGPQTRGAGAAKMEGGGIGERISVTMDVITQCHGIVSALNEVFEGPGPEGPKTSGNRPSAGLLSDISELQDTVTRLRDRLDELIRKL